MNESPSFRSRTATRNRSNGDDDDLSQLRSLIVGPEQAEIEKLQEQLKTRKLHPEEVGQVLPEAIALKAGKDSQLTKSLMPAVEEGIRISVKKDSKVLVDALFPVMGPAIRKAISAAINDMIQSLNQSLEQSFSIRGLRWRLEALRTGKPFAEIVLLHSLRFRVEQVFLIHKPSGLLLQHVSGESGTAQDADMVSGMLTAIQDFVRDSFRVQEGDTLNSMQVGELNVWIEQAPHCILAAVIRGSAPVGLRTLFQHALESIHREKQEELKAFQGDPTPFEGIRHYVESCIQAQYEPRKQKTSPIFRVVVAVLLLAIGLWSFFAVRNQMRWRTYVNILSNEPGIVVTQTGKEKGNFVVAGLRDPLAADPIALLNGTNLDPKKVIGKWEPYEALQPGFILKRANDLLEPPPGVTLNVEKGNLIATGSAPHQWIQESRNMARAVAGVRKFDISGLQDADLKRLETTGERISESIIQFVRGKTILVPGQEKLMYSVIGEVTNLDKAAQKIGRDVQLEIVGHADQEGNEELNLQLSRGRADRVYQELAARGLKRTHMMSTGVGSSQPLRNELTDQDREFNRSVSFKVHFLQAEQGEVL